MGTSLSSRQLESIFVEPFRSPEGRNRLLVAGAIVLASLIIPLLPLLLLYGYVYQITRRIIVGEGVFALPEWSDWGKLALDGLRLLGAAVIYLLPFVLLLGVGYAALFVPILAAGLFASMAEAYAELWALFAFLGWLLGMALFGLALLAGLVTSLLMPPALAHVAAQEDLAAAFRVREWWPIFRANLGGFLTAYLLLIGASLAINLAAQVLGITVVLCCLVPFLSALGSGYLAIVSGILFGQAYRAGAQKAALPGTAAA